MGFKRMFSGSALRYQGFDRCDASNCSCIEADRVPLGMASQPRPLLRFVPVAQALLVRNWHFCRRSHWPPRNLGALGSGCGMPAFWGARGNLLAKAPTQSCATAVTTMAVSMRTSMKYRVLKLNATVDCAGFRSITSRYAAAKGGARQGERHRAILRRMPRRHCFATATTQPFASSRRSSTGSRHR